MPPPAYEFRGNNQRLSQQPRHEFTFRYPRAGTSERPLLRTRREVTPELLVGQDTGDSRPAMKFARIENLSDSEEAEMDVSSDEDDELHPRKKSALESNTAPSAAPAAQAAPTPKWSNPDPYTALPPPDESQNKRLDVVKLIRKARLAASVTQPEQTDAVVSNEDFISLAGLVDEDEEDKAPGNAPTGPRRHLYGKDPALGNRKRTHDDEIKGPAKLHGKLGSRFSRDGSILDEWKLRQSESGTPWLNLMQPTLSLGTRLHNEILSFYHWVKPMYYEQVVREDLVARLQAAFQSRYYGVQLRPFGSFASGLYLPTADIDLVLLSTNFMRNGIKTFGERKGQIYAFAAFLKNLNIAIPGSIETIAHARVPILKFVDKLTGLKVDLSFDNDSGLIANNTFQQWKSEYPAMPVIVSVIKQFLLLRGLNEVPTGGLGGFSITCLVTSLLQHMPYSTLSPNLGGVLMDFFQFYGDSFDYKSVGIRLNPPGYFNKRVYKVYKENNNARLSIEDPNNPDNDISGGTREIVLIFKSFSDAHRLLKERMISVANSGETEETILGTIIAANFDEYRECRFQLREVFQNDPRFDQYRRLLTPPPPPRSPAPSNPIPPPPPTSSKSSHPLPARPLSRPKKTQVPKEKLTNKQKKVQAAKDRAARLKRLRPEIPKIPAAISNEEALRIGGYKTQSEMDKDLIMREKEISVTS
ncbi:putative topoisomerase family protein TRF4 [Aspergillus lucknowensis]|uniref:polynucleotide adenylyltransferase n=1 Tax=Aspergillus lucknowensis TaxID=176173 RepID=A0ABR4LJJ9_9EURO